MPFHYRLFGERIRWLFFIYTTFKYNIWCTSIYEPVSIKLAQGRFKAAMNQNLLTIKFVIRAFLKLEKIITGLTTSINQPNKNLEVEIIRRNLDISKCTTVKNTLVDIWLEDYDGTIFLIDLKTVKPNIGNFKEFKRTLLEWVACELAKNPDASVESIIAMPYNPFEPEPYHSWQLRGMLDIEKELKVGKEYWDFIGGDGTYEMILECFQNAGNILKPSIDSFFAKFNTP